MKKIFPYKSLTKNWPTGRRKATVLTPIPLGGSAMLWRPIDYKEPSPSQEGGTVEPPTAFTTGNPGKYETENL
jgi:hypothetical protein